MCYSIAVAVNKKIFIILIALLLLASLFFLYSKNGTSNKELLASGHPAWAPIMYQQGDQIVGAGPEIVKKVFSDLGIKVNSKYEGSWDIVQNKAKDGSVDVLVAAYKTTERETYMDYSIPYTVDPVVLVVKKGKAFPYEKWEDLIGKKGVSTIGDSYGQNFDNFIKEKLSLTKVATPEEAFALLDKDGMDYFVYALYSAENYISKNKISDHVEIIPKYVSTENFYMTISKKSSFANLMPKANSLLEKYIKDGTIKQIIEKNKQSLWSKNPAKVVSPTGLISEVNYRCNGGKKINAKYYEGPTVSVKPGEPPVPSGKVELVLGDGRKMTLPQTISGSGIRYATSNESMIFWSKGDSVFIVENNAETYSNCNSQ